MLYLYLERYQWPKVSSKSAVVMKTHANADKKKSQSFVFVIAIGGLVAILVLGFCGSTPLNVSFVVCIF